jgi:hypothetical protein
MYIGLMSESLSQHKINFAHVYWLRVGIFLKLWFQIRIFLALWPMVETF